MDSYTWEALASTAGATAATLLIVQYIKCPLDKFYKIPTRLLVYIIGLVTLGLAQGFTVGITAASVPLLIVNAFIVAMASMGAYEATFRNSDSKPPDDTDKPTFI